jgi:hypothetical protein
MMKSTLAAILVLGTMSWIGGLKAQTEEPKKTTHQDVRVVTGCLSKQGTNEYRLTAKDGSTWDVKSDAVPLAEQVGHTVTLTGAVDNPTLHGVKEDAKETVDKNAKEHGHMAVTKLKKESDNCKK